MMGNFPNLVKKIDIQVQEAQRGPNRINPKRPTPRHNIIKMLKGKEKILKVARKKQFVTYKRPLIRLMLLQKLAD